MIKVDEAELNDDEKVFWYAHKTKRGEVCAVEECETKFDRTFTITKCGTDKRITVTFNNDTEIEEVLVDLAVEVNDLKEKLRNVRKALK